MNGTPSGSLPWVTGAQEQPSSLFSWMHWQVNRLEEHQQSKPSIRYALWHVTSTLELWSHIACNSCELLLTLDSVSFLCVSGYPYWGHWTETLCFPNQSLTGPSTAHWMQWPTHNVSMIHKGFLQATSSVTGAATCCSYLQPLGAIGKTSAAPAAVWLHPPSCFIVSLFFL